MNRKTYRICLLMMVIITIIGGIFYYTKLQSEENEIPREAVFVMSQQE